MNTYCKLLVMVFFCFLFAGCASLLPSSKTTVISLWEDFDSTKTDYGKIFPGKTTMEELNQIGFDPYKVPNIRILNSTDTINIFLSNPSIRVEDLDRASKNASK